jgi:hypothetical protein
VAARQVRMRDVYEPIAPDVLNEGSEIPFGLLGNYFSLCWVFLTYLWGHSAFC